MNKSFSSNKDETFTFTTPCFYYERNMSNFVFKTFNKFKVIEIILIHPASHLTSKTTCQLERRSILQSVFAA